MPPERTRHVRGPLLTVAEDSGLVIDALDGEPGVHSARYLSPEATYDERFAAIQSRLNARPDRPRTARFVCALAVVEQGRVVFETRGTIEGLIAREARGGAGFGYDPIFEYPPLRQDPRGSRRGRQARRRPSRPRLPLARAVARDKVR